MRNGYFAGNSTSKLKTAKLFSRVYVEPHNLQDRSQKHVNHRANLELLALSNIIGVHFSLAPGKTSDQKGSVTDVACYLLLNAK